MINLTTTINENISIYVYIDNNYVRVINASVHSQTLI